MAGKDGLEVEIGITLGRLTKQLAKAEGRMVKTANKWEKDFTKANRNAAGSMRYVDRAVKNTGNQLRGLRNILISALSVRQIKQYADAWTVAENKIAAAGQIAGRAGRELSGINDIATSSRSGLSSTADLYAKLLRVSAKYAKSELEVARATDLVNKSFKAGGAAESEQRSGILQLSQGLSSGILAGDELRSVRENAPLLAQAIADEFNVSIGALKELGAQGELTADRVFAAILNGAPKIEAAFAATNATIGEGLTLVFNALTEYVGGADDSVGATEKLGSALAAMAENIDAVVAAGGILAGVFIGPVLLRALTKAIPVIKGAALALTGLAGGATIAARAAIGVRTAMGLLGGPIGVVIAGLSALPLLIETSGERVAALELASGTGATVLREYADASKKAADEQDNLAGKVSASTAEILAQSRADLQSALSDLKSEFGKTLGDLRGEGLFDKDDLSQAADVFGFVSREIDGIDTEFLDDMAQKLRDFADGKGDIQALNAEMSRLAGIGDEVERAFSQLDLARLDPANVDLDGARQKIIDIATAISGFEDELSAIESASGPSEAVDAFEALRIKMLAAAEAGRVLRLDQISGVVELMRAAGATEEQIGLIESALEANNLELQELVDRINDAETVSDNLGQSADDIDFNDAISGANNLTKAIQAAFDASRQLAAGVASGLEVAQIKYDFRGDRLGGVAALAGHEFDSKASVTQIGQDTDFATIMQLEAERKAFIDNKVAVEELIISLEDYNSSKSGGGSSGGGGSDEVSSPDFFLPTQDEIARLETQIELVGATAGEVARLAAEQGLLNEAKARGLELDTASVETGKTLRESIAAQAAKVGELTAELEMLNAQQQLMERIQDTLVDVIFDVTTATGDASAAMANLAKEIAKAALQAALFGAGPLAGLFGGTVGSGLLSGLFGFADGGFTGAGGKNEPKGIVHGGEYVFSKKAVQMVGVGNLDNLHKRLKGGYAEGGFVGGSAPIINAEAQVSVLVLDNEEKLLQAMASVAGKKIIIETVSTMRGR